MGTPEFAKSRNERKKVEMRFAHLKTHHGFERMRLRGLSGARDEFHFAAIVQNLKPLASYFWHPPPHIQAASLHRLCERQSPALVLKQCYRRSFQKRQGYKRRHLLKSATFS